MTDRSIVLRTPSGISGDMLVSGLSRLASVSDYETSEAIDEIGVPELGGALSIRPHVLKGISGWHAQVDLPHQHHHRTLSIIRKIIAESRMSVAAQELALATFTYLGEAEAKVHDVALDEVHFHEVGALDSILDICMAAIMFTRIAPRNFYCSPLPICDGTVRCEHGLLSTPPPAVQEMLTGVPVYGVDDCGETVTPTALAFLRAANAKFGRWPEVKIERSDRVYGSKVFENLPNGAIFYLVREG